MEFECKCSRDELENIKVGARVNLDNDSPVDCCLHFNPEGDFVITDTLNAKKEQKFMQNFCTVSSNKAIVKPGLENRQK